MFENHPHTLSVSTGSRIKANRLQRGWTQAQLAKISGVAQGVIANYENDARTPSAPKLAVFARAFGISLEELIDPVESAANEVTTEDRRVHGNSLAARIQGMFQSLTALEQRAIFNQVEALLERHQKQTDTPKRRHKVA
jgi:transcriptional regulator with XRE-family HTH domain